MGKVKKVAKIYGFRKIKSFKEMLSFPGKHSE